eukprot:Sspe_Gene.90143::Locus_61760_Transcript_1_1_Confidence_1.000_Length_1283::g.90143::m.90143
MALSLLWKGDNPLHLDRDAFREKLARIRRQVEHSKKQRAAYSDLLKEQSTRKWESQVEDADADATETASTTSESSLVSSLKGDDVARAARRKPVVQKPTASPTASMRGAAETRKQLEEDAKRKKAAAEEAKAAEEQQRLQAQKEDPQQEKGGWVEMPGLMGWGKRFIVVRKDGVYAYKQEIRGRGTVRGEVKYEDPGGAAVVPFKVTVENSRGSKQDKKSVYDNNLTPEDSKKVDPKSGFFFFGVQYLQKEKYEWALYRVPTAEAREEWCSFIAKYIAKRRSLA